MAWPPPSADQQRKVAPGRPPSRVPPRSSGPPPATVDSLDCRSRMFSSCISAPGRKASLDDGLSHFHRRYSERGPSSLRSAQRTSSDRAVLLPPRRPDGGRRRLDEWINHLVTDGNSVRLTTSLPHEQAWRQNEIRVAPLARQDDDDPPRPGLRVPPNRRNEMVNVYSDSPRRNEYGGGPSVYVEPPNVNDGSRLHKMNVVFLQAHDEVKRAILPPDIQTLYQVKMAFVRAFPNINRHFIDQPQVKIYIQEPSKSQLFYELEDPRDITDKSVLRLRDHSGSVSPMPFAAPGTDYHSENEIDDDRRMRLAARPASAMAEFIPQKPPRRRAFEDESSQSSGTRSGSVTPVNNDRESKERMETMERQLAGLSSLVHSALVSKGMNERTQRDMAHLRREILALHESPRESSEEPQSLPESLSSHAQHQLHGLSQSVQQAKSDARQLRRMAQINAQTARSLLREAGDQIARIVISHHQGAGSANFSQKNGGGPDRELQELEEIHASKVSTLLNSLTNLENEVEAVRSGVLNSNKKLKMTEVEQLTIRLARLGGEAAALKESFGPLQAKIEETVKSYMEKVLREEKMIKEQTSAVDQSLRRCKALANIMVTMKKLAMVQDPALQKIVNAEKNNGPMQQSSVDIPSSPSVDPAAERPAVYVPTPPPKAMAIPPPAPPAMVASAPVPTLSNGDSEFTPPVPPIPSNYNFPLSGLDGVLEEVGRPGMPPRPPSRFSVPDVRQKFTKPPELPEQLKSIIEDAIKAPSTPTPERDVITERRQELEQRQERLVEKQRQLRNQFLQLQQYSSNPSSQ